MYVDEIYTLICSFKFILRPGETPLSSLQHVYCILILLMFIVIFLDDLHIKYPLPIEFSPCFLSSLLQMSHCTMGSSYFHITH